MADKLLFCVSAQQVTAAQWRGGHLAECRLFANDDAGLEAFEEFLAASPEAPAYLMVDAVEEDYRFETLPHAFGSDRREMVQRKLRQHYRNTTYATAVPLGRDAGKRRDDRYLFCALSNPDLVAPWLQAITARGLPVAGLYPLPLASAALLGELRLVAANLLVVCRHGGGLRLTFFRDRQFRLSRLTNIESDREGGARPGLIAEEVSNTRIYLHALRAARLEEQLTVVLLDRNDELAEAVQRISGDNPGIHCMRLGRKELAARLRIPEPMLELSSDVIYLRLLAQRTPAANLVPANVTEGYRRYELRRATHAATAVVALVGTVWSAINVWQAADAHAHRDGLARQTAVLQARYAEVTRQFPEAPASADNLMRAVQLAGRLRESVRTPEMLMAIVARALDASPAVAVLELGWRYGVGEVTAGGTAAPEAGVPGGARRQTGYLEGEIRPFRGDYRAAIEAIHAFAARLAADPAVAQVRIVKLPLNINPALALSGNTLDSREQKSSAEFAVSVVLKPNL